MRLYTAIRVGLSTLGMAGTEVTYYVYPGQVRDNLAGKTVLVIGSGRIGARSVWDIFKDAKIKVIMVAHHRTSNYGESKVDTTIYYDYYTDQSSLDNHASNIIGLLGDRVGDIDGCFTFTEPDTPITAAVCQKLGLRGVHPTAALTVRSKQKTYEALRSKTRNTVYDTEQFSPESYRIRCVNDIKEAKHIKYPAILKPEHDAGSWGVTKVMSADDCVFQYNRIQTMFTSSTHGEAFGRSMVLMELLDGLSYNVDLVVYDGELVAAFITDMGLYVPGMLNDTTTCQPTNLSGELKEQLIIAAHHCFYNVGLLNGVFNAEFKKTRSGFKLVEINGRVGCYRRCIVYKTTHGAILWEIAAAIACGIKPYFPKIPVKCFAVGAFLFIKYHWKQFLQNGVRDKLVSLAEANDIILDLKIEVIDLECEGEYQRPFCHLIALNNTSTKYAREALLKMCHNLGLLSSDYDIERFTEMWA